MGDRANVYVKNTDTQGVFLYSHWGGTELPATVQKALKRKARWDDEQYLARIIFDTMTDGRAGDTGFGISAVIGDNSYPIIYLDCRTQEIGFAAEPGPNVAPERPKEMIPFAKFIEQDARWPSANSDGE